MSSRTLSTSMNTPGNVPGSSHSTSLPHILNYGSPLPPPPPPPPPSSSNTNTNIPPSTSITLSQLTLPIRSEDTIAATSIDQISTDIGLYIDKRPFLSLFSIVNDSTGVDRSSSIYDMDQRKIFVVKPKPGVQLYSSSAATTTTTTTVNSGGGVSPSRPTMMTDTTSPMLSPTLTSPISVSSNGTASTTTHTNTGSTTTVHQPPPSSSTTVKQYVVKKIVTIENSVSAKHILREATVMSALSNRPDQLPNDHILKFVTLVANESKLFNLSAEYLQNHPHDTFNRFDDNDESEENTRPNHTLSMNPYDDDHNDIEETNEDEYYRAIEEAENEMPRPDDDNDWKLSANGQTWINMASGLLFTKTDYRQFPNSKYGITNGYGSTAAVNNNGNSSSLKKVSFSNTVQRLSTDEENSKAKSFRPAKVMRYYLVMEFAQGGDLSRWMAYALHNWKRADDDKVHLNHHNNYSITKKRSLTEAYVHLYEIRTKSIAWQTLSALDYMHGTHESNNGDNNKYAFIHRDLKPDNLFVRDRFALDLVDLREIPKYPKHFYIYVRPPESQRRVNFTDTVIYDRFNGLDKNDEYAPEVENELLAQNAEKTCPYILLADFDRSKIKKPNENIRDILQTNADTSRGKNDFLPPDYFAAQATGDQVMNEFRSSCGADLWALGLSLVMVHFTGIKCRISNSEKPEIIGPKSFLKFCEKLRETMAPFAMELWRRDNVTPRLSRSLRIETPFRGLSGLRSPDGAPTPLSIRTNTLVSNTVADDDDDDEDDDDDDDEHRPSIPAASPNGDNHVNLGHSSSDQSLSSTTLLSPTVSAPVNNEPYVRGQPVKIKLEALVNIFRNYSMENDVPMPTIEFIRFIRSILRCDAWGTPVCTANIILANSYLHAVCPNFTGRITNKDDWDEINDLNKHNVQTDLRKTDRIPPELPLLFQDLYRLGSKQLGVGFCLVLDAVRENSRALETHLDDLNKRKYKLSSRYGPSIGTKVAVKWYRRDTMKEQDAHHLHKRQLDRRIVDRSGKPLDHKHIATIYAIFQQEFSRTLHVHSEPTDTSQGSNVSMTAVASRSATNGSGGTDNTLVGYPSLLVVMKQAAGGPFDQWLLRRGRDIALNHVEALKGLSAKEQKQDPTALPQLVSIFTGPRLTATIIGQLLRTIRYMHREGQSQTDIRLYALFLANHAYELDNLPLESEANYRFDRTNNLDNHRSVRVRLELPQYLPSLTSFIARSLRRRLNRTLQDTIDNDERKKLLDSNAFDGVSKQFLQSVYQRNIRSNTGSEKLPTMYRLPRTLSVPEDVPTEAYVPDTIKDPTDFTSFLPEIVKLSSIIPQLLLSPVNVMKSYDAYFYRDEFRLFSEAEKESPAMDIWAVGEIMLNMLRGYTIRAASLSSSQMENNSVWHRTEQEIRDDSDKGMPTETYDPLDIVEKLRQYDPVEDGSTIDYITEKILSNRWFQDFDCSLYEEEDESIEKRRTLFRKLGRNIAVEINKTDGFVLDDCKTISESELEHEILKTLGIVNQPSYLDTLVTSSSSSSSSSSDTVANDTRESSGSSSSLRSNSSPLVAVNENIASLIKSKEMFLQSNPLLAAVSSVPETESPVTLLRVLIRERNALEHIRWMNHLLLWINVLWIMIGLGMLARKDFVDAWFAQSRTTSYILSTINVTIRNVLGLPLSHDDYDYSGRAVFFMVVIFLVKCYAYYIRTATSRAIDLLSGQISARTLAGSSSPLHQVFHGQDVGFTVWRSIVSSSPFLSTVVDNIIPHWLHQLFSSGVNDFQQLLFAYVLSATIYETLFVTDAINTSIVISSDSLLIIAVYCLCTLAPSLLGNLLLPELSNQSTPPLSKFSGWFRYFWLPSYLDTKYWYPTYRKYVKLLLGITCVPILVTYISFMVSSLIDFITTKVIIHGTGSSTVINSNVSVLLHSTNGTMDNRSNFTNDGGITLNNLVLCIPFYNGCLLRNALDDEISDICIYLLMSIFSIGNLFYYHIMGKHIIPIPLPRKVWK